MAKSMQTETGQSPAKKREYGVYGLMEFKAVIPAGKGTLNVSFTGGSVTAFGVVPATFSTSDPVVIHLLEKSEYFRNGKIKRIRERCITE